MVEEPSDPGFSVGDLVMPINRRGCGKCMNCIVGRPDYCETGGFVEAGMVGLDGFMVEQYYEDPRYLVKVPRGIRDIAILAQPLADLEKSMEAILWVQGRLMWRCGDGTFNCRRALVIGTGAIGILFSLLLRSHGFEVHVANRRPPMGNEEGIFREAGVAYHDSSRGFGELLRDVGEFDLVINASTAPASVVRDALILLRSNGVLGLFGFPGGGESVIDHAMVQRMIHRNNTVIGLVNGQKPHFQQAMNHLAQWKSTWPGVVGSLITKTISVDDADEVLGALRSKEKGEIKVRIRW
jgi:aldose 1-dehydrogenase [NAD(P)+]